MTNQLVFKNQTITPVIINNLPYLRVPQIAGALNYNRPDRVIDVYTRHADEFTPDMSFLTTIDTAGGKQQVRVFSLRGCHLLAMFSKTPVAKEFRRWVLDLIEQRRQEVNKPVIVSEHTRSLPSGKKEIVLSAKAREEIGGITKAVVGKALEGCKVIEYVNPIKNILSDDLLTESGLTPMEIETHLGHLLTGLGDYKKSSADMYKLYRLLEACKGLACRYYSYASHLQGHVDFCEHYRGKNAKYFEMNTDALYATVRGMLDTKIELSAL